MNFKNILALAVTAAVSLTSCDGHKNETLVQEKKK